MTASPTSETPSPDAPAADPSRTLLLVDGSSYLYRAFHAMPDLRADPADPSCHVLLPVAVK